MPPDAASIWRVGLRGLVRGGSIAGGASGSPWRLGGALGGLAMMQNAGALGGVFVSWFRRESSQISPVGPFPGCSGDGDRGVCGEAPFRRSDVGGEGGVGPPGVG